MVYLEMDMPKNCNECEYIAAFDEEAGCVLVCEENQNGLKRIIERRIRPAWCPLHEVEHE